MAFGGLHIRSSGLAALPAWLLLGGPWSVYGVTAAFLTPSSAALLGVLRFRRFVR